jgi:hypothetical protein
MPPNHQNTKQYDSISIALYHFTAEQCFIGISFYSLQTVGYCFASLAMTRLKATKERERDRCKITTDRILKYYSLQRSRSHL